ncbi:hypothetical protein [Blastococcus atacamensis]|uniref:hypothetical protein n=1 Tax=Blastococcus atacamensis TaxID=2070508 RepID=UPI000CECA2C6|nr:hypothetical protein [Blastococcus atacamensis]
MAGRRSERAARPVDLAGPGEDRSPRVERVLRGVWTGAVMLSLVIGVLAVPIGFIEGRNSGTAAAIESAGTTPRPVVLLRQRVEEDRYGYGVEELLADYRTDDGDVRTAQLHSYGQFRVVREEEGWHLVPDGAGREVYVTADGRDGFLAEDYREMRRGEDDVVYRVAYAWVGGWAVVGLVALGARSVVRVRRGVITARGAVLAPALHCLGAVALVALGWAVSFPLGAGF